MQVTCKDLSTFKQKQLPDLHFQKKILIDGLACVHFHKEIVSPKLIATKAIVIGLKAYLSSLK